MYCRDAKIDDLIREYLQTKEKPEWEGTGG
jgi:hypothetical protein